MSEPRSINDGPWCWQNKVARRIIRDAFDSTHDVDSALGVYAALAEISSDQQSESLVTTHSWIARMSGLSPATVKRRLATLAEIGLISVSTPQVRAPSRYTLNKAIAHGELTLAHGPFHGERATSEEWIEESQKTERKERKERTPTVVGGARDVSIEIPLPQTIEEVLAFAKSENIPEWTAGKFFKLNTRKARPWHTYNRSRKRWDPIANWKDALRAFRRSDRDRRPKKRDRMSNDEFWKWIATFPDPEDAREAAGEWVRLNDKKDWTTRNKLTDAEEPLFDFKAAFAAYYDGVWCEAMRHQL